MRARINDEMSLVSIDAAGDTVKKERIADETPKPAHQVE